MYIAEKKGDETHKTRVAFGGMRPGKPLFGSQSGYHGHFVSFSNLPSTISIIPEEISKKGSPHGSPHLPSHGQDGFFTETHP